jgi:hypothetical protein
MNPFQRKITDFIDRKEKDSVADRESDQTTTDICRMGMLPNVGVAKNDKHKGK